jgi:A/G-specific adenine glycosylase
LKSSRRATLKRSRPPGQVSRKKIGFFQRQLLAWYAAHGRQFSWRNPGASAFYRILAELLLQRTKAESADRALMGLTQAFGTWEALAKASEKKLQHYLKPLGLWRRRIPALKQFAAEMHKRGGVFPQSREELETIPAVGQYIANAIMLFVHNDPQPLLDVNMARLLERFFGPRKLADLRDDPYLQDLARAILVRSNPLLINWAVLDFAALVCRARQPRCSTCPLARQCLYLENTAHPSPGETSPEK